MKKAFNFLLLLSIVILSLNSCYYDNEEDLYPNATVCDTTNVTYSVTMKNIVTANCNVCHNTPTASGGIITDTYEGLKAAGLSGKLVGAVTHASGFSPMPKGGNKLSDCTISSIKIWVNQGCPNN